MNSRLPSMPASHIQDDIEFHYQTLLLRYKEERERTKMLTSRASTMMGIIGMILTIGISLLLDNQFLGNESFPPWLYLSGLSIFGTAFALIFCSNLYQYFSLNSITQDHIFPSNMVLAHLPRSKINSLHTQITELESVIQNISRKNKFSYRGSKISDVAFYILLCLGIFALVSLTSGQVGNYITFILYTFGFILIYISMLVFHYAHIIDCIFLIIRLIYQKLYDVVYNPKTQGEKD